MIKNRKLFTYLFLLFIYELGLIFGSIFGRYWIILFLWTGVISSFILILIEKFRGKK